MAYGARLESVLGATPHEFESRILRRRTAAGPSSSRTGRFCHDGRVFTEGQVVTVFRSRLRPDHLADYDSTAALMSSLAAQMPGYVEHKAFTAEDGERVTVVTFADRASQQAWRLHPDHQVAQRRGRESFYTSYSLQVAEVTAVSQFPHG